MELREKVNSRATDRARVEEKKDGSRDGRMKTA